MTDEIKKHSSEECLAFVLDEIRSNPNLIKFHVNLITNADIDMFNNTLWPGVFVESNWFRQSTRRPSRAELQAEADAAAAAAGTSGSALTLGIPGLGSSFMAGGGFYYGTDLVIRTFVNELWEDYTRKLEVIVREEGGELTAEYNVAW